MTARNYDVTLGFGTVNALTTVGAFEAGNVIIGNTSAASGTIANVDLSANTIKVKLSNSTIRFVAGEYVHANVATSRIHNVEFSFSNANSTGAVVNEVNYAALNPKLEEARFAQRTAGNTFVDNVESEANALILPIPANNKNEITVLFNNTQIHPTEYLWTGDLVSNVEQIASFGGNVQLNSQTTFNVTPMAANAVVLKFDRLTSDNVYTVRVSTANLKASIFEPAVYTGNAVTASGNVIESITNSAFIAEKNAFTQNPIVRLIDIYYPGEWYPPNKYYNPTGQGTGSAWPNDFPFRIAEINGDIISDINYNVTFDGGTYKPYPINISAFDQKSDGEINELTVNIFNFENIISALVEDPFIAGNNSSNSCMAMVNDELLHGIDPRTINFTPAQVGGTAGNVAFDTLTRARANGLSYDATIVGTYGKANASFTRSETLDVKGTWQEKKIDSRDLLGAVVVIKTTFANFLDVWPEYSTIRGIFSNAIEMHSTSPYRVGDNVKSAKGNTEATITSVAENRFLFLSNDLYPGTTAGDAVYIINTEADPESYLEDVFRINSLDSLNDTVATFSLTSWLQYFKFVVPKRKFYKNTCQWEYKGEECQYPGPGGLAILGTSNTSPSTGYAADNSEGDDVCGKSLESCTIRHNQVHFGGFPATGRTIPRQ